VTKGLKIAVGGKGGVGKTTVCAVWSHLFARDDFEVMAIDADPNTTLASALAVPGQSSPRPLIEMKQLIAERTETTHDAIGAYFKMNPHVGDLPDEYATNVDGVKLLVLGGITQAGSGCACPEGAFLKALLTHSLLHRKEAVIVDLAAGVEFMGRAAIQGIDALVAVVEPGARSIETANNIAAMATELGIKTVAAVANKIVEPTQTELITSRLRNVPLIGAIAYDRAIQQADLMEKPAYEAGSKLVDSLQEARVELMNLIAVAESATV
jgi:CO dehydrogenase maturation factor